MFARLAGRLADHASPRGFRALLNSFLPRKRAIAQMLVRDTEGRVLLCRLTYKQDWDLPGGVVEVGESPHLAVAREVEEELGLEIDGRATCCSPTGCRRGAAGTTPSAWCSTAATTTPSILDRTSCCRQREIRDGRFSRSSEIRERAADFTARRIDVRAGQPRPGGPSYTESGQ